MPIKKWQDRRGKLNIYVTKQWPDQTRFRGVMPNSTVAKKTLARIEESIAMGTWRDLKSEFETAKQETWNPTVKEFSEVYLEEYCRTRNRRPDFKEETLSVVCRIVGNVRVRDFKRQDAHRFVQVRSSEVQPAPRFETLSCDSVGKAWNADSRSTGLSRALGNSNNDAIRALLFGSCVGDGAAD